MSTNISKININLCSNYKGAIDNIIDQLPNEIKFIYGGHAEENIETIYNNHLKSDQKFNDTKCIDILTCTSKNSHEHINAAKNYLIERILDIYGKKCINLRSNITKNTFVRGDNHKLYIIYK